MAVFSLTPGLSGAGSVIFEMQTDPAPGIESGPIVRALMRHKSNRGNKPDQKSHRK
jgi:hypothetical protein